MNGENDAKLSPRPGTHQHSAMSIPIYWFKTLSSFNSRTTLEPEKFVFCIIKIHAINSPIIFAVTKKQLKIISTKVRLPFFLSRNSNICFGTILFGSGLDLKHCANVFCDYGCNNKRYYPYAILIDFYSSSCVHQFLLYHKIIRLKSFTGFLSRSMSFWFQLQFNSAWSHTFCVNVRMLQLM